ncbi:protein of unknown function DUF3475 [Dillenia turbinata]|uniref:DUF668 domain-containing protein n=1 Tax=Dillenia turbinata TaxID=194707 RepID=A0AAN8VU69_9MAGN
MVAESWFRGLWRSSNKKEAGNDKLTIGVLAFEVASLMSKLVYLWQSLSGKNISRLREELSTSDGIRKLVSESDDYIVGLVCAELLEGIGYVARSISRLAKKCSDSDLKSFEFLFDDLIKIGADPGGWTYSWKKMERKVKKMERFVLRNANLYQEMEILSELEQMLRRMRSSGSADEMNLLDIQKKVGWKQQEVKHLQDVSVWNRNYDYTVRLLARSLFTIFRRIKHVFGIEKMVDLEETNSSSGLNTDYIHRSRSVSGLLLSSVHPSENGLPRFSSGPLGGFVAKSGPLQKTNDTMISYSGPLGYSITKSGPLVGANRNMSYSGPLVNSTTKSGPIYGTSKTNKRLWPFRDRSTALRGTSADLKPNRSAAAGAFKGCIMGGNTSPEKNCFSSANVVSSGRVNQVEDNHADRHSCGNILQNNLLTFCSKPRLLNAPAGTLGAAGLALHYANVIIVIEKLAASPHLIGHDARDDLYNMLPSSIRSSLRERLRPCSKSLAASIYDTALAGEWTNAIARILEWLAPLAHNMIRWQTERSFEQQSLISRTNVLLVQTLYFADQEKTEMTITELLVGLNYVWRFGREINAKALMESASSSMFDNYLDLEG